MSVLSLQPGDAVLAGKDIFNDGSFPDSEPDALLVKNGTRGVIIQQGHLEEDENQTIFLVRFELESNPEAMMELGPPIGCLVDDLDCLPVDQTSS